MAFLTIKSWENNTFRYFYSLNTKKGRSKAMSYIIEGERFVREALASNDVEHIVVSEKYAEKNPDLLGGFPENKTVILLDYLFDKIASTENTQGIMAVCTKRYHELRAILRSGKAGKLFILAEDVSDPGNLGVIIRTADAAGADAAVLSKNCVELHNPKVLRATAGATFHMPIIEGAALSEIVTELKDAGVRVFASHLAGRVAPYHLDLTGDCAFIVGNEARGLSDEASSLADALVRIPMPGRAESLNAAMASGVLIYEAVRQRYSRP